MAHHVSSTSAGPSDMNKALWIMGRLGALLATVALLAGLVLSPVMAEQVLWNLVIPILPASFLIAPQLWRGVCPLATMNQWSGEVHAGKRLSGRALTAANVIGIGLLFLMVPARRFLFNENGPALAATIVVVALFAAVLGVIFDRRAGFCNGVCPVLPVERFYGQHPLVRLDNRRCDTCSRCIPKGCVDLNPEKSFQQALGKGGQHAWLLTAYGAFAAAMPGFIVGYYTTSNGPLSSALSVYLWVGLWCAASYMAATVVVRAFRLAAPLSLALLAAAALSLYYWWAPALAAEAWHIAPVGVSLWRVAAWSLVMYWLVRAWPSLRERPWQAAG